MKTDIDIIAYALRKAIKDQQTSAEHRKREGNIDAENGCHARISRMRRELDRIDAEGAVAEH